MLRGAVFVSVLIVALGASLDLETEWSLFREQFAREYVDAEVEQIRKEIFSYNLAFIERHNALADKGLYTYWLGVNNFTDMTHDEFVQMMNGLKYTPKEQTSENIYVPTISDEALPATVDWRKKGYVTPVKDQGQCGSCWAFSTTGSLEGQHFKKDTKLVSLSEQNLVDCSQKEGNMGCNGGLMDQAFKYIKVNKGIDTESSYPYKAEDEKCKFKKADVGATLRSWTDIKQGSEADLEKAVAEIGPISVGIDASHNSFQLYKKGVYNEPKCSKTQLDHGVLAVGYGKEGEHEYWLVKNSWGKSWGEEGYIMMSRNKKNQCGIATQASFPVV